MGGKSGAEAAQREAERARAEEKARQERIRQGTGDINRIFGGGLAGSGQIASGAAYDPSATYYRADGTKWTPTGGPSSATPTQQPGSTGLTGFGGAVGTRPRGSLRDQFDYVSGSEKASGLPSQFGGGQKRALTPEQQFAEAMANGGLYSGTEERSGFNDKFYQGIRDSFTNYAMPQLNDQRANASKELTFALDRSGQLAGSVRGQKAGELQKLFDINEQQVRDQALSYENQARTNVENARADLIAMLNATGDNQQAVNSALSRSTILTQPQAYSPLGQLFTDFTAGLGTQAAHERAFAAGGPKPRYDTGLFGGSGRVVNRT